MAYRKGLKTRGYGLPILAVPVILSSTGDRKCVITIVHFLQRIPHALDAIKVVDAEVVIEATRI